VKTYVATENRGKLAEMRAMFADSELQLETYPDYSAVEEAESTYAGNALLKARALQGLLQRAGIEGWVLADDSGLEVDALGGRPGVLSARYAGENATWPERRGALLDELRTTPVERRGARFVSHIVLLRDGCAPIDAVGSVDGRITERESGGGGFGYDPIFYYEPTTCTFAELSEERKNAVSHRRRAVADLLGQLRAHA
jgi:XTP/dITP diphosphohydrolase